MRNKGGREGTWKVKSEGENLENTRGQRKKEISKQNDGKRKGWQ